MRYTKRALLLFGLGLVLGLAIVAGGFTPFGRVASAVMALALVLLPVGLVLDLCGTGVTRLQGLFCRKKRRGAGRARSRRKPVRRAPARRRR